jgi:hypothetical protein
VTIVKKSIYRNQGRKSKPGFYWILFVMPEDYLWKWNPFCNIKDAMYWWNLNPACNIFCKRYYIYYVYILVQFSNGQETRINEPTSPLLRARDED